MSSTRVPLTARPKDLVMFGYFVAHTPTTVLMDLVPLYPSFVKPYVQPLIKFTGAVSVNVAGVMMESLIAIILIFSPSAFVCFK